MFNASVIKSLSVAQFDELADHIADSRNVSDMDDLLKARYVSEEEAGVRPTHSVCLGEIPYGEIPINPATSIFSFSVMDLVYADFYGTYEECVDWIDAGNLLVPDDWDAPRIIEFA